MNARGATGEVVSRDLHFTVRLLFHLGETTCDEETPSRPRKGQILSDSLVLRSHAAATPLLSPDTRASLASGSFVRSVSF